RTSRRSCATCRSTARATPTSTVWTSPKPISGPGDKAIPRRRHSGDPRPGGHRPCRQPRAAFAGSGRHTHCGRGKPREGGKVPMKLKEIIRQAGKLAKPFRITDGEKFRLKDIDPGDTLDFDSEDKPRSKEMLATGINALAELQDMLYAQSRWAVLLIFQAM